MLTGEETKSGHEQTERSEQKSFKLYCLNLQKEIFFLSPGSGWNRQVEGLLLVISQTKSIYMGLGPG